MTIQTSSSKEFCIGRNVGRKEERERQAAEQRRLVWQRERKKWYRANIIIAVATAVVVAKGIDLLLILLW